MRGCNNDALYAIFVIFGPYSGLGRSIFFTWKFEKYMQIPDIRVVYKLSKCSPSELHRTGSDIKGLFVKNENDFRSFFWSANMAA